MALRSVFNDMASPECHKMYRLVEKLIGSLTHTHTEEGDLIYLFFSLGRKVG
jgi:hypothetical protein